MSTHKSDTEPKAREPTKSPAMYIILAVVERTLFPHTKLN